MTKKVTSAAVNSGGGFAIGWALGFAPVTGGLSIALLAGGSLLWGLYGSEASDYIGHSVEELFFD